METRENYGSFPFVPATKKVADENFNPQFVDSYEAIIQGSTLVYFFSKLLYVRMHRWKQEAKATCFSHFPFSFLFFSCSKQQIRSATVTFVCDQLKISLVTFVESLREVSFSERNESRSLYHQTGSLSKIRGAKRRFPHFRWKLIRMIRVGKSPRDAGPHRIFYPCGIIVQFPLTDV